MNLAQTSPTQPLSVRSQALLALKDLCRPPIPKPRWPLSLFPPGLAQGAITQLIGQGKTECVARFLQEHPHTRAAWLEQSCTAFPWGFWQRRIDPSRLLFVEPPQDFDRTCLQLLRARVFAVVVVCHTQFNLLSLRRFQLACEKSQTSLLWLSPRPHALWPVYQHLRVQSRPTLSIHEIHP